VAVAGSDSQTKGSCRCSLESHGALPLAIRETLATQFELPLANHDGLQSRLTPLEVLERPGTAKQVEGQHIATLNLPPFGWNTRLFEFAEQGLQQLLGRQRKPARLQAGNLQSQTVVWCDGKSQAGIGYGGWTPGRSEPGRNQALVGLETDPRLGPCGWEGWKVPVFEFSDDPGIELLVRQSEGKAGFVPKFIEKLQRLLIGLFGELSNLRVVAEERDSGGVEGGRPGPGEIREEPE